MEKTMDRSGVIVGVGGVVFRGDDVLLIKRGKPPFKGHWSIPGGKLETGETLHDAVRREIAEETSIVAEIVCLIDVFEAIPGRDAGNDRHMLMIDYVARWVSGEPRAGDDAAAAEFVPLAEAIERLSWDKTRDAVSRAAVIAQSGLR
ncbi:MAG: NUDIX hydrolase [Pseudomonadota bacterium]